MAKKRKPLVEFSGDPKVWERIGEALDAGFTEAMMLTGADRSRELRGWVRLAMDYFKVEEIAKNAQRMEDAVDEMRRMTLGVTGRVTLEDPEGRTSGSGSH